MEIMNYNILISSASCYPAARRIEWANKKAIILINYFARRIFPRLDQWDAAKKLTTVLWVVLVSVVFATVVGAIIFFENSRH